MIAAQPSRRAKSDARDTTTDCVGCASHCLRLVNMSGGVLEVSNGSSVTVSQFTSAAVASAAGAAVLATSLVRNRIVEKSDKNKP